MGAGVWPKATIAANTKKAGERRDIRFRSYLSNPGGWFLRILNRMAKLKQRLATLAFAGGFVFVAMAVYATEGAIAPPHRPVSPICPCISHVQCRDMETTSIDGTKLRGWYYTPDNPNGAAILMLHGVGGNRADVIGLGAVYERAGYSVLTPDIRGHGESGGVVTYGIQDERDVQALADWMLKQPGISRIYGYGASLGASVLLESLRMERRFRAVVAESPYSSFPGIGRERIARQAPPGLKWLAGPFVEVGLLYSRLRFGINFRESSPLEGVRHSITPVLLAHGVDDHRTGPQHSRDLAAVNPSRTELWLKEGAGHADLWGKNKPEFEARTLSWFAAH